MEEGRLPKEVMKWRPQERRKRGRLKHTWVEERTDERKVIDGRIME